MPWNAYTAARFSQRVHAIGHRSRKHFNQHSSNSLVPRKLSSFLSLPSRFYFSSTCVAYSYTARNSMQLSAIRYGNIVATRNGRNKRFKENMYLEGRGGKIISKANISIDLWREIKDRVPILNFCISSKVEKLWATKIFRESKGWKDREADGPIILEKDARRRGKKYVRLLPRQGNAPPCAIPSLLCCVKLRGRHNGRNTPRKVRVNSFGFLFRHGT